MEVTEDPVTGPDDPSGLAVDELPEGIAVPTEHRVDERAIPAGVDDGWSGLEMP